MSSGYIRPDSECPSPPLITTSLGDGLEFSFSGQPFSVPFVSSNFFKSARVGTDLKSNLRNTAGLDILRSRLEETKGRSCRSTRRVASQRVDSTTDIAPVVVSPQASGAIDQISITGDYSESDSSGKLSSFSSMILSDDSFSEDVDVSEDYCVNPNEKVFTTKNIESVIRAFVESEKVFINATDYLITNFLVPLETESKKGNGFISEHEATEIFIGVREFCNEHKKQRDRINKLCDESSIHLKEISSVYDQKANKEFISCCNRESEYYSSAVVISERLRKFSRGYAEFLTKAEKDIPAPYKGMKFEQFLEIPLLRVGDIIALLDSLRPFGFDYYDYTLREMGYLNEAAENAKVLLEALQNGYEAGENHERVNIVDPLIEDLDKFIDIGSHERKQIGIWNASVFRKGRVALAKPKEEKMTIFLFNTAVVFTTCNLETVPPSCHTSLPTISCGADGKKPYTAKFSVDFAKLAIRDLPAKQGVVVQGITFPRGHTGTLTSHSRDGFFMKYEDELLFIRFDSENETNEFLFRVGSPRALTKVFGVPLQELLIRDYGFIVSGQVPHIIEVLADRVREEIDMEGVFRVSPSETEKKELKNLVDSGECVNNPDCLKDKSVFAVSVVLKELLSSLPRHLCNDKMYERILEINSDGTDIEQKAKTIFAEIKKEPIENKSLLFYLFNLLEEVVAHSDTNKMGWGAISTVVTPRIVVCPEGNLTLQTAMQTVNEVFAYLLERKQIWGKLEAW